MCEAELCTPPPWRDAEYLTRRLIAVENPNPVEVPAGVAIPVKVGPEGLLSLDDVGTEGRFSFYGGDTGWVDQPLYRDLESDGYTAWIPLAQDLKAEGEGTLAWVESRPAKDVEGAPVVDPTAVFENFDSFDGGEGNALGAQYREYGLGEVLVADGPTEFAESTVRLLGDQGLQRRLATRGRILAETHYDWRAALKKMDSVYAIASEQT